MTNKEYRTDIDGLRAVAVLAVLFYHIGIWPFTGGFVGVDIFFVISGFLITKIIYDSETAGRFSYLDFYVRRVRRLLPALFVAIVATFAVGAWIFLPEDFARLAGSAASALVAASNIFFWYESGYFDVAAKLKPLLHTWSLAVEIQFYLFWPAFIVFLVRRRAFAFGVVAVSILSLAAAVYVMSIAPTMVFYFTPFRIFEFAMGGLVFAAPRIKARWLLETLFIAGIALILWCVFSFTDQTPFPGWTALPPCIGAALIVYAGNAKASLVLRAAPVVWIGQISYSLYLVHWPIIVYSRYGALSDPTAAQDNILIALTFLLAAISYYAVESPLRKPGRRKGSWVVALASAATLVAAVNASMTGWTWRYSDTEIAVYMPKSYSKYVWYNHQLRERAETFTSDKLKILVVGDSQSADFTNILVEAGIENEAEIVTRTVFTECGLPYLREDEARDFMMNVNSFTIKDKSLIKKCIDQHHRFINSSALNKADIVVVGYYWRDYSIRYLKKILSYIKSRSDARIIITGMKDFSMTPSNMAKNNGGLEDLNRFAYSVRRKSSININNQLRRIISSDFIDIFEYLCPQDGQCSILDKNGMPTYWGSSHLTPDGARFFQGTEILSFLPIKK